MYCVPWGRALSHNKLDTKNKNKKKVVQQMTFKLRILLSRSILLKHQQFTVERALRGMLTGKDGLLVATLDELAILKVLQVVVHRVEHKDCQDLLWILTKMETDEMEFDISGIEDLFGEVSVVTHWMMRIFWTGMNWRGFWLSSPHKST